MTPLFRQPLIDASFLENPYPAYRALREAGPIHWSEEFFGGAWLLTRHLEVEAVLGDGRFSARRTGGWVMNSGASARTELLPLQRIFSRAMLFLDSPDHTRLRPIVQAGFKPAVLKAAAPRIEQLTKQLLDEIEPRAGFDFMARVARPLPARVIAMLMGIPDEDRENFLTWADDLARFIGAARPDIEVARRAQTSVASIAEYFGPLLALRRRKPTEDLIGCLVQAEAAGELRSAPEVLAQCAMLLFAGYETTRNLLGNGLYLLLKHRDQWQRLQSEPALMPNAVRELLRYESPVQYTGRRVAANLMMHERLLHRGELVIALLGAACRDPARYEQPDRLDITRPAKTSLAFGHGPHACVGAALTLMEAEIAFREVLRRWPNLELAESAPRWAGNPVYRGLATLRVRTA